MTFAPVLEVIRSFWRHESDLPDHMSGTRRAAEDAAVSKQAVKEFLRPFLQRFFGRRSVLRRQWDVGIAGMADDGAERHRESKTTAPGTAREQ